MSDPIFEIAEAQTSDRQKQLAQLPARYHVATYHDAIIAMASREVEKVNQWKAQLTHAMTEKAVKRMRP
jgi:hypothetical protein